MHPFGGQQPAAGSKFAMLHKFDPKWFVNRSIASHIALIAFCCCRAVAVASTLASANKTE
jgi:hypothetical protein